MLRLIFFAVLLFLLYRLIKSFTGSSDKIRERRNGGVIDDMVQDPFCKTYIPRREALRRVIGGSEFHFCSKECADKFEAQNSK